MADALRKGIRRFHSYSARVFNDENPEDQVADGSFLLNAIEHQEIQSLEKICEGLIPVLGEKFKADVAQAMADSQFPLDGLVQNQSATLRLYTMPTSLHRLINEALRSGIRDNLLSFLPYLKLLYTALFNLP